MRKEWIANLIQAARSPQEKMNIAVEAFGRSAGPAMVAALSNGAAGLRQLGAEAQTAGAIIDNDLVAKAKDLDDKWNKLTSSIARARNQLL